MADAHKLDRFVATCQIGITISSLVVGAYGQTTLAPVLTPYFERWGGMQALAAQSTSAVTILILLTATQMIFGELVPKSLALQFPTKTAMYTVIPMEWSIRLFSWFIVVLNGSGLAILRIIGVRQTGHVHIHTAQEIDYLIAESRQGGLFEADEHARLREALRLGVTTVNEVMVPRVEIQGIRAGTPFPEMLRLAAESPYTRIPVFEETLDHVTGYIHVQNIVRRALDSGEPLPIHPILIIPEGMNLERVLERLRVERQHMALVSDEYGGTAGLVTITDILDEIMGGVAEDTPADPTPEWLPDGRVRLPGSLRVYVAAELLGVDWEGESATVGGLVTERLGRLPQAGDRLVIERVAVEVESANGRTVTSVIAGPMTED